MQKIKNKVTIIFSTLFVLLTLSVLVYFFNDHLNYENESKVKAQMDLYLKDLTGKIKDKRDIVLTAAVLLAKDNDVKACLAKKSRINCTGHLNNVQEIFNNLSFSKNIKIHVHTKDLKSFFRLWELGENKNDSLSSFRESLLMVKDTKKELSGVEIGRSSMLLRGISPVLDKDEYLGSIEVITDFNSISSAYRKIGINFYVIMHKRYKDIVNKVSFGKDNKVGDFLVINDLNSRINPLENIKFKGTNYIKKENYYILYTPVFDITGHEVGYYILKINENKIPL
jgi:hypothetical protein